MRNVLESQHDLYKKSTHIKSSTIPKLPHLTIYAYSKSPYSYIGIRRSNLFFKQNRIYQFILMCIAIHRIAGVRNVNDYKAFFLATTWL